jgi:creatinine amidohydrolase
MAARANATLPPPPKMASFLGMPSNLLRYELATGPEVKGAPVERDIVILTLSAPENHGAHLPLGTDQIIGQAVAERVGERLARAYPDRRIWLHPTWHLGGATIRGDGSLKVPSRLLRSTLKAYLRRFLRQGFRNFLILSAHGGVPHVGALDDAAAWLRRKSKPGRPIMAIAPAARLGGLVHFGYHAEAVRRAGVEFSDQDVADLGWDLHGGRIETSMVLAAAPDTVRPCYREMPVIEPPRRAWLNWLMRRFEWPIRRWISDAEVQRDVLHALWAGTADLSWILRGRREGYVGKPHLSSAAEGHALLDAFADDLAQATQDVLAGRRDPNTTRSGAHLLRGLLALAIGLVAGLAALVWWLA